MIFNPPTSYNFKSSNSKIAEIFLYFKKTFHLSCYICVNYCFNRSVSKLKVENSFINYFDKDTEIYKGMKNIDEKLGEQLFRNYY